MNMKTKPTELLGQADLKEWREPEPEKLTSRSDGRDARITKTVRMRLRFSEMLRDQSYQRSVEIGKKVSEADLLDEALSEWRIKHGIHTE